MSNIIESILSVCSLSNSETVGCQVITDSEEKSICGNTPAGHLYREGVEIQYCESANHIPSEATPWNSGRIEPLTFYLPEEDRTVEVA